MAFGEIDPRHPKFDSLSNSWRCTCKKSWGNNIIIYRLHQVLWIHTQRKDGANTTCLQPTQRNRRSYNDRNTKVKVRTPDGDTDYFDIVAGGQKGNTLAPYLFIICLDYVLRILLSIDKIQENGFKLTRERSRRYPAQTITDADYADDIALLANTPTQA